MEGTLWKWTNYFSGWQPRWFVLEDGILSYYRSQEDVVNGCKGSVKMSVCDVTVHGTDNTRLDLIIPGEAHFYVKAATPQERQQWLVALGTSKACLTTNNRQSSNTIEEFPEEQLKAKKSELRLYCDLLMQQVHSVKQAVSNKDQQPNIGQLNESTSLLSATCDTFIQALEECMTMAHADTMNNIPQSPSRKSPTTRTVPWGPPSVQRSLSVESPGARKSGNTPDTDSGSTSTSGIVRGYIPSASAPSSRRSSRQSPSPRPLLDPNTPPIFPESPSTKANSLPNPDIEELPANLSVMSGDQSVTNGDRVPTIFSSTDKSFCQLTIGENGEVPTDAFLNACRTILPIFDKLNPTSFAPVMLDLGGNIKKLEQKFSIDRDAYSSIQAMILTEVAAKQHSHSSSATTAMLWLKRGLEFICEFLRELLSGVDDIMTASNTAYSRTLKPFHNFVNRGAYALAVKSAPTKPELYRHFSIDENDVALTAYQQHLEEDMKQYVAALDKLLANINAFYVTNDLDSQDMV